jgi:radical SAM protein (TIGR01212 family)
MSTQETLFYSYSRYLHESFGGRTYKVTVASGLTCPTRDGTLAKRGCAFCDLRGSASFFGKKGRGEAVRDQLERRIPAIRERFKAEHFLAYFQSYTNTYSDVEYLRGIYEEALATPGVSGLCIGTRPDCLPDGVIDLLEDLAREHYVSLELGVQSFEDPTLEWLDRGHDGKCSIEALEKLRSRAPHVHTCAHFIFGSPTDSPTAGRDAALLLNRLGVRGTKLHQLMVLEHTVLAERYQAEPFRTLTLEEYCEVARQFLEHLDPAIYIERLAALASHWDELIAPKWSGSRWEPQNAIKAHLVACDSWQGKAIGARRPWEAAPALKALSGAGDPNCESISAPASWAH